MSHFEFLPVLASSTSARRGGGAVLTVLVLAAASLAQAPAPRTPPPITPPAQPLQPVGFQTAVPPQNFTSSAPATATPAAPAAVDPMDYPLRLLADAAQSFQAVRDYTCVFVKQEQIGGKLQTENVISTKVRQQPFSVSLRWLNPKDLAGQEVCYVAGRNNGMLRVHATGLRGAVGFISLAPNDPRVTAQARHPITEAGIGNLIETLQRNWSRERGQGRSQVRAAEYDYARRKCIRVEVAHTNDAVGHTFYAYRSVVYFDRETHLPIRAEAYDWPRRGGPPEGDLLECYSYVDLRFNTGLADDVFTR